MALKPLKTLNFGGEDTYYLKPEWKNIAETTTYGDTLTWDGNTDGLVGVQGMFFKVSDAVPTIEDVVNGCTLVDNGAITELTGEQAQGAFTAMSETVDGFAMFSMSVLVIPYANYEVDGMPFPEAGVYFGATTSSLTINGYNGFEMTEVQTIDPKYLPVDYIKQLIAEVTG